MKERRSKTVKGKKKGKREKWRRGWGTTGVGDRPKEGKREKRRMKEMLLKERERERAGESRREGEERTTSK